MQYIEYEFAKDNNIVGLVIHEWLKHVQHLSLKTKGLTLQDWREGRCLLLIGDKSPKNVLDILAQADWAKSQIKKKFHNKAYQSAYLKQYLKI